MILGSPRIAKLPVEVARKLQIRKLQILRCLYFRDDEKAVEIQYKLKREEGFMKVAEGRVSSYLVTAAQRNNYGVLFFRSGGPTYQEAADVRKQAGYKFSLMGLEFWSYLEHRG
ncbi:hypothetical protein EYZ11_009900 [Aspergillus tanneri]|uniref:Uncharacterized protein n=1 Tax=Aspergillus tanneri TaxID=1220188 RepID=A0A4S3J8T6_9EURO|nr:uncharacterized protein ATNIH1004_007768 [Aspergillus tanneri]KAA8646341.1 hypothetical protein ATNIH1004_007768 [Aspergillus tanneri]THC90638.1 hypothetical protein EYZ11_009900 [Aspergillus tanneri]